MIATKSQGTRHSLPPKPMTTAPSMNADDTIRNQASLTESCILSTYDRQMEWSTTQSGCLMWNAQGWSTTPPFPTPSLTASSLSSSSLFGERSPVLGPSMAGIHMRNNFDVPYMTNMSPGKSLEDVPSMALAGKTDCASVPLPLQNDLPRSPKQCKGTMASMSSSFSGRAVMDAQGRDTSQPLDAASLRMATSFANLRQPTPLLIPMQPTGAGVPLTSVVETLSSKGSKAAAEDPETVAAAYKLSQWGIGIGPGINPKVASSRNGTHGRGRSTASEPPIVNTGNSGPMCVQPGDWICTSCGFVNWRRRDVCMRCFPYADGNEIGRGIQGGEMLAKRLAAGLETDTEEYKRSVQALCPDKGKRGSDTNTQRPIVHELPRNPVQAYGYGAPTLHGSSPLPQMSDSNVQPRNLLGIHLGSNMPQQWRPYVEVLPARTDPLIRHGYYQPPELQEQPAPSGCVSYHQQQSYLVGEHNEVNSPYKVCSSQMDWTPKPGMGMNSGGYECSDLPQHAALNRTEASPAESSLLRSTIQSDSHELLPQRASHQDQASLCRPLCAGWSPTHTSPREASSIPSRDIWAPAPKRPTQIRVDPEDEDVSQEKRVKPQPIGTRSTGVGGGASHTAGNSMTGVK